MREGERRGRGGGTVEGEREEREREIKQIKCMLDRNWKSGMTCISYVSLHTYTCSPNSQSCCNVLLTYSIH